MILTPGLGLRHDVRRGREHSVVSACDPSQLPHAGIQNEGDPDGSEISEYEDAIKSDGIVTILHVICDGLFGVACSSDGLLVMGCEWPSQKPKTHKDEVLTWTVARLTMLQEAEAIKAEVKEEILIDLGQSAMHRSAGNHHEPSQAWGSPRTWLGT